MTVGLAPQETCSCREGTSSRWPSARGLSPVSAGAHSSGKASFGVSLTQRAAPSTGWASTELRTAVPAGVEQKGREPLLGRVT